MTRADARVVAVVQARMGSTRLPGKALRPLAGRAALHWVLRAAGAAGELAEVVVATTNEPADDAIAAACSDVGVRVVRGSRDDVLDRFLLAADVTGADGVVRLTADCPLLDPAVLDTVVRTWRSNPEVDYVSSVLFRTLPRGLDVEIVSRAALERAGRVARDHHRVHVTSYVYTHPDEFRVLGVVFAGQPSGLRVTLDTDDDAAVLDRLTGALGDRLIGWRETVAWLDARPDVVRLNAHVEQKPLDAG